MTNKIYEQICSTKQFRKVLEQLPKDERDQIEKSLQALCDNFSDNVLTPLEALGTSSKS